MIGGEYCMLSILVDVIAMGLLELSSISTRCDTLRFSRVAG